MSLSFDGVDICRKTGGSINHADDSTIWNCKVKKLLKVRLEANITEYRRFKSDKTIKTNWEQSLISEISESTLGDLNESFSSLFKVQIQQTETIEFFSGSFTYIWRRKSFKSN